MAWNEPGKPGDKDPWGQRKNPSSGSPDLDQIVKNIQKKLGGIFGGGGSAGGSPGGLGSDKTSSYGLGLIVVVALSVWLATGFYVINQGERGVELKFGKKNLVTGPGLHWRFPWPIERIEKVNVDQARAILGSRLKEAHAKYTSQGMNDEKAGEAAMKEVFGN